MEMNATDGVSYQLCSDDQHPVADSVSQAVADGAVRQCQASSRERSRSGSLIGQVPIRPAYRFSQAYVSDNFWLTDCSLIVGFRRGVVTNMYAWIFLGSYAAALVLTLFIISLRAKSQANRLISRGIPKQEIDLFYREVGARARRALIKGTIITGTCMGAFGSLIAWLATK